MKKNVIVIMLVLFVLAVVVAPTAQALSSACDDLSWTVTDSFTQTWYYLACVGDSLATAWELFYEYW